MTDDEKFLFNQKLSIEKANEYSYENALDVIALGFDPKKTIIFSDIDYAKTLYRESLKVAKKLTFSTTRATFGFNNESNVGQVFFTSVQAVPAFLESVKQGKNVPCLIPHAIDQDPHFRIARDILPKLGYYKPASIQGKFLPGLGKGGKMSASQPETAIFTVDKPELAKKKIMNAFTGGRETIEEQRRLGGRPEICPVYHYYEFLFEEDDRALEDIRRACKSGELLCGEDKERLAERVIEFLKVHQEKREEARDRLEDYVVRD
jgi:tryptophanyl-tRNA synthetase